MHGETIKTVILYYVYYCIRATCFDSYRIIFRPFYDTDTYFLSKNLCLRRA